MNDYLIQKSDSFSRQDQTQLDSLSESKKYEPVPSDAYWCLFHMQFKRSW